MYAKWDDQRLYYLAQVTSVDVKKKTYNLHFMDGCTKDDVPEKDIRLVPSRERKKKCIGKRFFDSGDYEPGKRRKTTDFKEGEFTVLCYQPGPKPTYWCERETNKTTGKREIVEFFCPYVLGLIDKYDKE